MPNTPIKYAPSNVLQQASTNRNTPSWVTLDANHQTYYSGLDASVYFGDVWMGQLVNISYQLQEMVMPLYAYGDYTPRRMVHGARLVQGSFTLMFQQVHLMYHLLNYLRDGPGAADEDSAAAKPAAKAIAAVPSKAKPPAVQPAASFDPSDVLSNLVTGVTAVAVLGSQSPALLLGALASLSTQLKTQAGLESTQLRREHLKQIQAEKSAQFVQQGSGEYDTAPGNPGLLGDLAGRLTRLYSRYETAPDGFDIRIEMGRPPEGSVVQEWNPGLPIPKGYAQQAAATTAAFQGADPGGRIERALQVSPPYTTRKISGVHLTGMSQILDDSGRPLMEQYSFTAADLI